MMKMKYLFMLAALLGVSFVLGGCSSSASAVDGSDQFTFVAPSSGGNLVVSPGEQNTVIYTIKHTGPLQALPVGKNNVQEASISYVSLTSLNGSAQGLTLNDNCAGKSLAVNAEL